MRSIDADALIEKCGEWYVEEGPEDGFIGTIKQLIDTQPTIQSEQRWIPCGERLPEKNGVYIVSYEDAVTFLEWFNGKWFFYPSNPAREETGTITAWMPLPERYQGR